MYVVAGATGNTGKVVAEQLLAAGKEVRAWVRSAEKGAALAAAGAELAIVDLEDAASIRRRCQEARRPLTPRSRCTPAGAASRFCFRCVPTYLRFLLPSVLPTSYNLLLTVT